MRFALYGIIVCFLLGSLDAAAQDFRINELMASNGSLIDEDGDTPDWIELHNPSNQTIQMEGWSISDDLQNPTKWAFPNTKVAQDDYLFVWASGKDRKVRGFTRTLISEGDNFQYLIPNAAVADQWNELDFADDDWLEGQSGFGYGDGDDSTILPAGTRSIFLRKKFVIDNISEVEQLILHMDYDDGFVAYINGIEVARANITGTPPRWSQTTIIDHEAELYDDGQPELFLLDNFSDYILDGENVLAIQGHNVSASSSDFTMIPFLSAKFNVSSDIGITPPTFLDLEDSDFHTNFKISSKGETIYLFENGNLKDSLSTGKVPHDYSMGRSAQSNDPVIFANATPGAVNDTATFKGVVDKLIDFSVEGGSITPSTLKLSGVPAPYEIKYTIGASEPTISSNTFTDDIAITRSMVVRARIFLDGYLPSPIQTQVYRINATHELPVVDLVTDNDNLYDIHTGIYASGLNAEQNFPHFGANFWEDWEKPVYFSFDNGDQRISLNAGLKIFGGWSRGFAQKSLSIFARERYGTGEFKFPFFKSRGYSEFQALVLRNSGNDWNRTMFRDGMVTSLMEGSGLDLQAYQPTVVYINGSYWGIQNLREKINEHFVASKHNVDASDVDLLELDGQVIFGSNASYLELIDFVSQQNMASDDNYARVADQVDIDNMIVYQIAQIYFNNTDWPGNNIKYFKHTGGKWRWVLFDTDFGLNIWNNNAVKNNTLAFALNPNGPEWPNPPWSTLLFRKLIQNQTYRHRFVNRFADEMNSRFLGNNVNRHIDEVASGIRSEIGAHFARWGGNQGAWSTNINRMKSFATQRPSIMKEYIKSQFGLPNHHTITINNRNVDQGYVRLNSLTIDEQLWQGDYFETVPIQLIAIPRDGYSFSHWEGASTSTEQAISLDLTDPASITPIFMSDNTPLLDLVINEINYNSADDHDTGDWIELYNPSSSTKDLSGLIISDQDDDDQFIFEEGTLLAPDDYIVIARNISDFKNFHPDVTNVVGNMAFGLSSNEDQVRLFRPDGAIIDSVSYASDSWPIEANGLGFTLELVDPSLDNNVSEHWDNIHEYGSPGKSNIESTSTRDLIENIKLVLSPNPAKDILELQIDLVANESLDLKIYNLNGKLVKQIANHNFPLSNQNLEINISDLSEGIYILSLKTENGLVVSEKFIKAN